MKVKMTKGHLEGLLRKAEKAHAEFERRLGKRDENWPAWYAKYIVDRLD